MLLIFVYTYFKQVTRYKLDHLKFAFCIISLMQDNSEMTALQEKLSQTNNKVAEFRNQCEKLKKDLKVAHKVSFFLINSVGWHEYWLMKRILFLWINWQSFKLSPMGDQYFVSVGTHVLLGHCNTYPKVDHDQLDFTTIS